MKNVVLCAALLASIDVHAADMRIRAELGIALPLSAPQTQFLTVGPVGRGEFLLGLTPFLAAQANVGYLFLLPAAGQSSGASGLFVGAGLRAHRPSPGANLVPWGEASFQFHQSGSLPRASLDLGIGLNIRFDEKQHFWFGPQVRYMRIFNFAEATLFAADANILTLGIGGEFDLASPDEEVKALVAPVESDDDGDGLTGAADACPDKPGVAALKGCPDGDADGDGVADSKDTCSQEAEDKDGFQDHDGCPEPDNDKDGVLDAADACPETSGAEKTKGCPDSDGDGVANDKDQCPNVNGPEANQGCPKRDEKLVRITESKIEILQKIFFVFGKTSIVPKSFPLLDEVALALKDRENMCVDVEGHTDNVGKADANLALSTGRAQAVLTYLTEQGISTKRLTARGFGDTMPLESNAKPEGRDRNRRVEFTLHQCGKE